MLASGQVKERSHIRQVSETHRGRMTVHPMSSALRNGKTSQCLRGPPIPRSDTEPPTGRPSEDAAGHRSRARPPSHKHSSPCSSLSRSANPRTPPAPTRSPFRRRAPSAQARLLITRVSPASPPPCRVLPSAALARFSRTSETLDLSPGERVTCRAAGAADPLPGPACWSGFTCLV